MVDIVAPTDIKPRLSLHISYASMNLYYYGSNSIRKGILLRHTNFSKITLYDYYITKITVEFPYLTHTIVVIWWSITEVEA